MYRPAHFDEPDPASLLDEMAAHVPATLITHPSTGFQASILPFIFERSTGSNGVLVGHLARPNGQWREVTDDTDALAIFVGPDAYVSPSLYATKRETGKVVPTWDYVTVLAHGTLVVHDDPIWLRDLVTRLTDRHEASRPKPWSVDEPPPGYVDSMLRGIVGVELRITRLEGKRKLSQNRPVADQDGVIEAFSAGGPGEQAVAAAMEELRARRG
ncbi:MAG TPA: FMN-binding negative transcriptional regulator [Candidatus Saccharimonadales bacterium]|nr:FMN-binding negative transcriptional regulator [Candidatus Saccharimonadales bacterium]